jgi:hypothetical protein
MGESAKILSNLPISALCAYTVAIGLGWFVYEHLANRKYSSIMTLSGVAHCLGLAMLAIQVVSTRSAAGISARALMLDAMATSFRLSSTLQLHGYLPNDASGDYAYQCVDLVSMALLVFLLRTVLVTRRSTYQQCEDDMSIAPLVFTCVILGAIFHGDMDDSPLFDSLWLAGLFLSVVAVLPQYWMITKSHGQVHVLTAHSIAAVAVGRILSGMFMWYVRKYITCIPWFGTFEHTIYAILLAHLFHIMILSDFAFFYVRAVLSNNAEGGGAGSFMRGSFTV